jgi:hypothetical protein
LTWRTGVVTGGDRNSCAGRKNGHYTKAPRPLSSSYTFILFCHHPTTIQQLDQISSFHQDALEGSAGARKRRQLTLDSLPQILCCTTLVTPQTLERSCQHPPPIGEDVAKIVLLKTQHVVEVTWFKTWGAGCCRVPPRGHIYFQSSFCCTGPTDDGKDNYRTGNAGQGRPIRRLSRFRCRCFAGCPYPHPCGLLVKPLMHTLLICVSSACICSWLPSCNLLEE